VDPAGKATVCHDFFLDGCGSTTQAEDPGATAARVAARTAVIDFLK
jgi:hypothetical protein